jgi:hypothetical protein
LYVTGNERSTGPFSNHYATVAYQAATGTQAWVSRYNGGNNDDRADSIAVNPDSTSVYVTGKSAGPGPGPGPEYDFATIAYSTN